MDINPIPYVDFGGSGPLLHFAHPNGYNPGCFRQMLLPLTEHYHVIAVNHRPLWPGSEPEDLEGWGMITDDLLLFFDQHKAQGVIGLGHSLGAVATMMAAWRRPELFKALILIEPVFFPPRLLQMMAEHPEYAEKTPLAQATRKRRTNWPDRQAAYSHFRAKSVFSRWPDQSVWDYVDYGLQETADGQVALIYRREWELLFYTMFPLTVWEELPKVSQPILAIRGEESDTLTKEAWQYWQTLQPQTQFEEISAAGHMLPMEKPRLLAQKILEYLQQLK